MAWHGTKIINSSSNTKGAMQAIQRTNSQDNNWMLGRREIRAPLSVVHNLCLSLIVYGMVSDGKNVSSQLFGFIESSSS